LVFSPEEQFALTQINEAQRDLKAEESK